jgi:phosphatidylethanolamine N-methyltransferase
MWGPVLGSPSKWSVLEWLGKASILNLLIPLLVPRTLFAQRAVVVWFVFWRLAYDIGIGLLLRWQSQHRGMTRLAERVAVGAYGGRLRRWFCDSVSYPDMPLCFNAWVVFRQVVDVVLANDLMAYIGFALYSFNPPDVVTGKVVVGYAVGVALCAFALWAKMDSYRVVKDYAWYWGDFFFLVKAELTFDRVFKVAPHPMYTIGYLFFYGSALIARSYSVLYVSLFAHFCQLLFLAFFETPHMKKIYPELVGDEQERVRRAMLYDTSEGYFGKDLLAWKNFNPLRFGDVAVAVVVV